MVELAELSYKHDAITDPKDFSNRESYYSLDKKNPIKFEANNEVLLSVLKKIPQIKWKFWSEDNISLALKNIDTKLLSKDNACLLLEYLLAIQNILGENSTYLFIDKVLKVPIPVSVKLAVIRD